jgi:hypothetical protein
MSPKKIYLIKICGTYIETGALGTIDNQIVRTGPGCFYSTYDSVARHLVDLKIKKNERNLYSERIYS